MSTMASFTALALLATFTAAQQSVIGIPFYGYDDQPIVASVIAVQSSVVTLSLACAPGTDGSDCGLGARQTLTIGTSTYHMDLQDGDFTMTQDCQVASMVCVESAGGPSANDPGMSTTTYDATDMDVIPVTITAGLNLLEPASVSASPTGSGSVVLVTGAATTSAATGSAASTMMTSTGAATHSSSSMSGSGSRTAAAATSNTSNAAVATAIPALVAAGAGLMGLFL